LKDLYHGRGLLVTEENIISEGAFKFGKLNGPAKKILKNGSIKQGFFQDDKLNG